MDREKNEEVLDKLNTKAYSSPNTVQVIKSRRVRWAGHVAHMGEGRGAYQGERDHWGDPGIDGRTILRCYFRKWDVGVWTGSSWLRTGTGGRHF
jgi:hypothetical protein